VSPADNARRLLIPGLAMANEMPPQALFLGNAGGVDRPGKVVLWTPKSQEIVMTRSRWFVIALMLLPNLVRAQDSMPPSVAILTPAQDDHVGGMVTVSAVASDNVGVKSVKFYKGTMLVTEEQVAPFSTVYDFNADPSDANYVIKVTAADAAGNEKSAEIVVNKPRHDFRPPGCSLVENGAFFKVWAPHAQKVALIGEFNHWHRADHLLRNAGGWWFGFQPGVTVNQKYRFVIDDTLERPDPYGRQMEHSAGASIVKDPRTFAWTDGLRTRPAFENMILYELHVGTFIGKNDGQPYPGNFKSLLTKLDYIKGLGANMIELLPVHEVPGPDGGDHTPYLGYAPTGHFAVESSYGSATGNSYDDLKLLVNVAHEKGLGVILDVVYNHFSDGKDRDNWYRNYDGDPEGGDGGIYFHGLGTQWGIAPDWQREEVQRYVEDNCRYWLVEFHVDGLRWDVTTEIKNKPGGWQAMRDILWKLRQDYPGRIMICENLPYEKEVVESGNFHSGWWVKYHHNLQEAMKAQENANLADVKDGVNGGDYSHVSKRVVYAMSHDEARNGGSYLVEEFGGRSNWDARAKARAMAALMFMLPGIPMMWQGEEFAQDGWFNDNRDHAVNWSYEHDADGSQMKVLYQDAIQRRRDLDALRRGSLDWTHEDQNNKVLAFRRDWGDQHVLVVVNFSAKNFTDHSYGVYAGMQGQWTQILCSQDSAYGGWDGAGNAYYEPSTRDDGKVDLNLPKFGVIVMKRK
jgi:1,4-alpha-glucan branching enzyme